MKTLLVLSLMGVLSSPALAVNQNELIAINKVMESQQNAQKPVAAFISVEQVSDQIFRIGFAVHEQSSLQYCKVRVGASVEAVCQ